jgi:hypothetical protein
MNECDFKAMINRKWPVLCLGRNLKDINEYGLTELKQDGPSLSGTNTLTNEARTSVVEGWTSGSRISEAMQG